MPKKARESKGKARAVDPRLRELRDLAAELADEQCGPSASFAERSEALLRVMEAALSELSQEDTDAANEREDPER